MTFDEIMAPLGAETFVRDYLGRQPLHLQGPADKFEAVMNWEALNRLLGMTSVWTDQTMLLILDNATVPAASYASPTSGREGGTVMRPDPARVQPFLARGATMVLNFIDQLSPELSAFARSLERALGGTVQANLYLSSKRKQGFKAHFDFHDVFAMHVMGEKTWTVFQGRAEYPIKHPSFEGWPRERHDQIQGEVWREVPPTAGRPALPATRPVSLCARRRRPVRAYRLGRYLPDRHGRGELRVRADGRRGGRPRQPAAGPGSAAGAPDRDRPDLGADPGGPEGSSRMCWGCPPAFAGPRDRYDLPGSDRADRGGLPGQGRAACAWSRRVAGTVW